MDTLAAIVRQRLELSWSKAKDLVTSGRVTVDGEVVRDIAARVEPERVEVHPDAPRERRGVLAPERLVFADRSVAVVNKPPGLLTIPYEDERDTLVDQTRALLRRQSKRASGKTFDPQLGVVHRIDKGTSGLLVFTRTLQAKRHLQQQFRQKTIHRRYVALVHGRPEVRTHVSEIVPDRGDGIRGSWGKGPYARAKAPKGAQRSVTHVLRSEPLGDFGGVQVSLIECRLETGRQHQIRIHLAEAGNPLVGEHVYIRDYPGERVGAERVMLHAAELGFEHPHTLDEVRFRVDPPQDFQSLVDEIRARR